MKSCEKIIASVLAISALCLGNVNGQSLRRKAEEVDEYVPYCPEKRYSPWATIPLMFRTRTLFYKLGYTADTWNFEPLEFYWNPIENYAWNDTRISDDIRDTVAELGYDEDRWDCCINHYEGFDWADFEFWVYPEQMLAYEALGWTSETYGTTNATLWPDTEFKLWQNLTEYQRYMAASKLCFTEETWDERLPLYDWPADFEIPDAW